MITWCVAYTQALKEALAQQQLQEQGFVVYLPRFKKIRRHARKVDEILAPLFPRYIFIGIDLTVTAWRKINGTRGISHLLMMNEQQPAPVPAPVIMELQEQEMDGAVPAGSLFAFTKGDKVRILEGAFKDHIALFESMTDQQRVQLLLGFLGRETKIALSKYAIEAA